MNSLRSLRGRLLRASADARRCLRRAGSAEPALRSLGVRRRGNGDMWRALSAERHRDYRQAIVPSAGGAAFVCVTSRPSLLARVIADLASQREVEAELVVVTNSAAYVGFDPRRFIDAYPGRMTVLESAPEQSLGSCLNDAMDTTAARYIAKIDDDDRYGPHYLADALRAHSYAGAGLVGKHTYYAHLEATDTLLLRFPDNEFRYTSTLAGGTLVLDRARVGAIRFEDRSIGEDRAFIAACHRAGVSTFSADRFSFVQTRNGDNTWTIADTDFAKKSETADFDQVDGPLTQ